MLAVPGDVSDAESIERLFAQTESRFGPCDILVNDAGTHITKRIEKMTEARLGPHFRGQRAGSLPHNAPCRQKHDLEAHRNNRQRCIDQRGDWP